MGYIPPFSITVEMLDLISEISEMLGSIKGVENLEKFPRLRRIGRIKTIHSSLAIENNTLSIGQVTDIVDGKRILGPPDEIFEVKNAIAAYNELEKINPFDMNDLLHVHKILMEGLVEENGRLRTVDVGVYNSDGKKLLTPPGPTMLPGYMNDLFEWLRASDVHILIRSSIFHTEFERIHPFRDGNGRIGRLWQTAVLMKWKPIFAWIPVESIIRERQTEYYNTLMESQKGSNVNIFIVFMLEAIRDAVKAIVSDTQAHIDHIDTRVRQLMAVLETYPQSAAELMERLNLKSRDTFRNNYLRPAMEAGLVMLTEPNKPTSKNQRYFKR
ncbi:MAG: Fic family protein [Methanomassiliicoccaceae archaeon]|nr:Fic family protein [Methanomassiliicoccaceae archaeon]